MTKLNHFHTQVPWSQGIFYLSGKDNINPHTQTSKLQHLAMNRLKHATTHRSRWPVFFFRTIKAVLLHFVLSSLFSSPSSVVSISLHIFRTFHLGILSVYYVLIFNLSIIWKCWSYCSIWSDPLWSQVLISLLLLSHWSCLTDASLWRPCGCSHRD